MSQASASDPELLPGLVRQQVRASQARARETRARRVAGAAISEHAPVARVVVDSALAHLDRDFDYAVPASMDADAVPGARVKVRFAGHEADGFITERAEASDHDGALTPLRRVVSAEAVLSPAVSLLAADLAARYAGTRSDVLRLAVPPRHATTEKQPSDAPSARAAWDPVAATQAWAGHEPGAAFVRHLAEGASPRAVWHAAPGTAWPDLLAHAAAAALAGDRGAVLCVPDGRDVDRVDEALTRLLGRGHHVALRADAGPAARYRDFLALSRGARRVAVGTRAAAYAPVRGLGLVAVWDDGDDLHAEPRAPYPHVRETLLLRAEQESAAALVGGFSPSVESGYLLRTGWASALRAPRTVVRERAVVEVAGAGDVERSRDPHGRGARVPTQVRDALRGGLESGPVLVSTPRRGYAVALACERCRTPCRCPVCTGPLAQTTPQDPPACRWCATPAPHWACPVCGARGLRAPVVGQARTAEELGRAFPRALVRSSSADRVLVDVDAAPQIVVATPGAEPVAAGGYAAVLLLDGWLLLDRVDLRAEEEALRRWSNAAGLVRPGGRVVLVADPAHPAVQALVRWDQPGWAAREAGERQQAHLPPASRMATLTGSPGAIDDAVTLLDLPEGAEVLGPVPAALAAPVGASPRGEASDRVVLRVPRAQGPALSRALVELQRVRSARKLDPVRVQVDPTRL